MICWYNLLQTLSHGLPDLSVRDLSAHPSGLVLAVSCCLLRISCKLSLRVWLIINILVGKCHNISCFSFSYSFFYSVMTVIAKIRGRLHHEWSPPWHSSWAEVCCELVLIPHPCLLFIRQCCIATLKRDVQNRLQAICEFYSSPPPPRPAYPRRRRGGGSVKPSRLPIMLTFKTKKNHSGVPTR